jgi:hypothetical protein
VTNRLITIMEKIGQDALKVLTDVEKYLPEASVLAQAIFPAQTAAITGVVNSVALIQKAVVLAEQKMAAGGQATGTGMQKSADVLSTVEPVVTQLLQAEGLTVDAPYIQKLTNAIVDILNVQTVAPAGPAAA